MELVRRIGSHLQFTGTAIQLQLPLYLRPILGLLLGVMVVVEGTQALTRFQPPPINPFAAYADMISGNASDPEFWSNYETLFHAAFELACITSLIQKYCIYRPEDGPFEAIQFNDLDDEGDIGIYFAVRDNALTVGDVARLWGRPTLDRLDNSLILHWHDQQVSTIVRSDNGQFSYFLPVPYLMLRR